ncbi:MAG: DUF1631 family protein [Rhodanobacteraceae bacterium]
MNDKGSASQDNNLPPRALNALEEQLATCDAFLRPLLPAVVGEAEKALFKRANQSRNNTEQEQCLASVRELKRQRSEIVTQVLALLPTKLEEFGKASKKPLRQQVQAGLELLAEQSQDQSIILDDISARTDARATMPLFELGHRYAVLAAAPIMDSDRQPFSPGALCDCIRQVVSKLEIIPDHQIEIYRAFDKSVLHQIVSLYDNLNARLIERGILPNLRTYAPRRQAGASPSKRNYQEDATARDSSAEDQSVTPGSAEEAPPAGSAAAPDLTSSAEQGDDQEMFSALSELLALRRRQIGPVPSSGKRKVPSREELNQALGGLQHKPSTMLSPDGKLQPRSMQNLRRDMLAQLRQTSRDGSAPHFSPQQLDVMELMTMLFDRLSGDIHSSSGNYLLSELQAPLLRVAMDDQAFFTDRQHPARHWLDKVAEASARWGSDAGDDDGDPALIERIHGMNRSINRDFDGDASIFDGMSTDLQKQLEQLAHKASVTERRYVEASKGRERLDIARRRAEELVQERIQSGSAPSLTRNLLQHAWTDVLALSLLREGEDSEDFRKQLRITEVLGKSKPGPADADSEALRGDIEQGLTQVGMAPKEADLLAREATGLQSQDPEAISDDQLTRTELAMKLKQRKPVGSDQIDTAVESPVDEAGQEHADAVARIRKMDFGTWFEFDDPEREAPVRRKMAWFSTRTGRCLFVNRRGIRTHDTTIDHLAQAMLAGTARLPPPEKGSFIDRAWESIFANLKKMTGGHTKQEKPA